jgi:succinate dehydrogenase/fumarate reductase flavoprotein subunit
MTSLESLGTVYETDLLIIGGGIGGLAAAMAAKERSPEADVLVVERATAGWAGQANKGAGIWWYLAPEDDVERFVQFHVEHIGMHMEDQELLADFARESLATLERVHAWTGKFQRGSDGQFIHKRFKPFLPWSLTGADHDLMRVLQRRAKKAGVRFIDKTSMVDLLRDGRRIVGAVGFGLLDGAPLIVKARAVIIATGGQSYRIMGMWSCQRGDGLGMAWRVGAEMRNAEWGPFAQLAGKRGKEPVIGSEDALYNAWHEKLSPRFRGDYEADVCAMTSVVWYQQMIAGNGPLVTFHPENWMLANTTEDVEGGSVWDRPVAVKFWQTLLGKVRAADLPGPFLEVFPAVLGELSPIKVDHTMATTVPGLYACGNACYNGSALPGAVPASPGRMRGAGLYGATWMGIRAGEAAVDYAAAAPAPGVDAGEAEALIEHMLAPLGRTDGVPAMELIRGIQDAVNPIGYSLYKHEERMKEALRLVLAVKARLPQVAATDPHYLVAAHDACNMALSAELFYRTALERKESRGWFVREDYPERDDSTWLKWINAADDGGEMRIWTEEVPVERYPFKPAGGDEGKARSGSARASAGGSLR